MGFHIFIVGYLFGIPVLLLCEAHLMIRLFLSPLPYTASRKSCQRCCKQGLIITPEITHYASRKYELQTWRACSKLGLCCSQVPISRKLQGLDPKAGATSLQARAPAYSDRLSKLEKDVAEIRDGTVKEVLEKLRGLSDDIEEVNKRFDTVDRTGDTLEDLRVRVYHHENEMTNLKRQVERGSAPLPPQNQQAGTDRFSIPMYSGERNSLSRFLKPFYTWALSSQSEDGLNYSHPFIMTGDNSRRELEREYGRQIVAQSLAVWNGLTKAVEKDKTIADIVVRAKLRQRHGRY